jgi:hypothetical protein
MTRQEIRSILKIHIYKYLFTAKIMAWILSRLNYEVFWVFNETEGYMVMNLENCERVNKLRMMQGIKKLRERDFNKNACYRTFPNWGKLKICS